MLIERTRARQLRQSGEQENKKQGNHATAKQTLESIENPGLRTERPAKGARGLKTTKNTAAGKRAGARSKSPSSARNHRAGLHEQAQKLLPTSTSIINKVPPHTQARCGGAASIILAPLRAFEAGFSAFNVWLQEETAPEAYDMQFERFIRDFFDNHRQTKYHLHIAD